MIWFFVVLVDTSGLFDVSVLSSIHVPLRVVPVLEYTPFLTSDLNVALCDIVIVHICSMDLVYHIYHQPFKLIQTLVFVKLVVREELNNFIISEVVMVRLMFSVSSYWRLAWFVFLRFIFDLFFFNLQEKVRCNFFLSLSNQINVLMRRLHHHTWQVQWLWVSESRSIHRFRPHVLITFLLKFNPMSTLLFRFSFNFRPLDQYQCTVLLYYVCNVLHFSKIKLFPFLFLCQERVFFNYFASFLKGSSQLYIPDSIN